MAQAMVGSQVKVVKGTANGCHGTVRAAIWLPSGDHMFGIELDEPKGTHNGRYKVNTLRRRSESANASENVCCWRCCRTELRISPARIITEST